VFSPHLPAAAAAVSYAITSYIASQSIAFSTPLLLIQPPGAGEAVVVGVAALVLAATPDVGGWLRRRGELLLLPYIRNTQSRIYRPWLVWYTHTGA
jgi:hypothetical protein